MTNHRATKAALTAVAMATASLTTFALAQPSSAASIRSALQTVTASVTSSTLPASEIGGVAVDDVHQRILITLPTLNELLLADFSANLVGSPVTGLTNAGPVVMSPDDSVAYIAEEGQNTIAAVDMTTHAVSSIVLPANECAVDVMLTSGRVWFAYTTCGGTGGGFGSYDPATSALTQTDTTMAPTMIRGLVDRPQRTVISDGSSTAVYDVSGSTPSLIAEAASLDLGPDAAMINDGDDIAGANNPIYSTADLSVVSSMGADLGATAVAADPAADVVAVGGLGTEQGTIYVENVTNPDNPVLIRNYLGGGDPHQYPTNRGMAWSASGTLATILDDIHSPGSLVLMLFPNADHVPTSMTLTTPVSVTAVGSAVKISGKITPAPLSGAQVSITRTDVAGVHVAGTASVTGTGSFAFSDTAGDLGKSTYKATFSGDATYGPSNATSVTHVKSYPFDFNGDGSAEMIVGAPLEDVGAVKNAGSFTVLKGTASGITATGATTYTQDTTGVPGVVESGDQFGWSNASGDFNGDGYVDLAVSSNAEDVGSTVNAGSITVFYGSPSGLKTTGVQLLDGDKTANAYVGEAVAVGDFNGDGIDDLAASSHERIDVYRGTTSGLSSADHIDQSSNGVPGTSHPDELWGFSMSSGDVNGDGCMDLAVGAPWDYDDHGYSAGSATVLYGICGVDGGLGGGGAQRFAKDTTGVPGAEHTFVSGTDAPDDFGWNVDLADFNGDGKADLVVSAPGSPVWTADGVKHEDAGTVTVLYSTGTKIGTTGAIQVSQDTTGVPGSPAKGDFEGATLGTGDANGDGEADLVMYSPGDHYVTLVKGSVSGLNFGASQAWTQNTAGIPDNDETGDFWGDSLRFENFKGAGPQGLAVGAEGENNGAGAVTLIYSTTSGLTATGSQYFDQDTPGVPGSSEAGDNWGAFYSN